MKMVEKLALQKELGCLVLFRDGLFLKAYNESAYILTELLEQELKIKCYTLKCLKGEQMVECAFQRAKLGTRLPKAVLTEFGARADGDYDLAGYAEWRARRWHVENEVRSMSKAEERPLQTVSPSAPSRPRNAVYKHSGLLPLTKQQLTYLQIWQKNLFPIEADLGFIDSLQKQLIQTESNSD